MSDQQVIDRLQLGDHVCWTFDDDEACRQSMAGYVAAGLSAGQQVLYYTHAWHPEALMAGWQALGVPAESAAAAGQLVVRTAADTYLRGGAFDPVATVASWSTQTQHALDAGWAGVRVVGDMAWAAGLAGRRTPGVKHLPWYEARVNQVFAQGQAMAVCLYDRRLFRTAELAALSAAHPGMLADRPGAGWEPLMRMRYLRDPAGLWLAGEVDVSNREALRTVLTSLHGTQSAVIDVSELGFADGATVAMLAHLVHRSRGRVTLRGCQPWLRRLLELVRASSRDTVGPR